MYTAMSPGSNHTVVITRTAIERNCYMCRQQKARSDHSCYFSHSGPKDPNSPKSPCFRTRIKFCFKDRVRMEQREPTGDPSAEGNEARLRELALKWFTDTQLPLIINNGLFPSWFTGFISRKDAENILREKELGCFLVRLSDKALGYILSYKGRGRCRHFVISQSETGQLVVCGDTEGHNTMLELIDYYKTRPIQPFGEFLTSSCFTEHSEDLYDTIQVGPKEKPEVVLRAAKNVQKQPMNSVSDHQTTRQQRSSRVEEEVPPLPRRSRHIDSSPLSDEDRVVYAQLKKQAPRENPRAKRISQECLPIVNQRKAERTAVKEQKSGRCSPPSGPESVYSELNPLDSKSKSLPLLDSSSDGEQYYRLSLPPDTPPRLSPKPVRQTNSKSSQSLDGMVDNAVYHLVGPSSFNSESPGAELQTESLYAEVALETPVNDKDSTYELLPGYKEPGKPKPSNTSEPMEDSRRKCNNSSWGKKNDRWKWLFPDAKRK